MSNASTDGSPFYDDVGCEKLIPSKTLDQVFCRSRRFIWFDQSRAASGPGDDSLRTHSLLSVLAQTRVAVSLGQPSTVATENQRNVGESGDAKIQGTEKFNLPKSTGDQIVPANDLAHTHSGVVDHNSKLVGRFAIFPRHRKRAKCFGRHT